MMELELLTSAIVGSFVGGLLVFATGALVNVYTRRRERRMQIIGNVARAAGILETALREGVLEPGKETWEFRAMYDRLTMDTLLLFTRREVEVALWTAFEFYAGYESAVYRATTDNPTDFMGVDLVAPSQSLPRSEELLWWAIGRDKRGPRYAALGEIGDTSRHNYVTPNSDADASSMLWPPAKTWAEQTWRGFRKQRHEAEAANFKDLPGEP